MLGPGCPDFAGGGPGGVLAGGRGDGHWPTAWPAYLDVPLTAQGGARVARPEGDHSDFYAVAAACPRRLCHALKAMARQRRPNPHQGGALTALGGCYASDQRGTVLSFGVEKLHRHESRR